MLLLLTAGLLLVAVPISPVFFLGLLGTLLLISRPSTTREWFWIAVCVAALVAWLRGPTTLIDHTVRAAAAFFVGAFVAATLLGVRSLFARASLAVLAAAVATVAWYAIYHLRFADLQNEIIARTWDGWRRYWTDLPAVMPSGDVLSEGGVADTARQFASALTVVAFLFPAWLALIALASARLTWSWYQRIAPTPLLPDAEPFRQFRFNDQLVWLVVLLAALLLIHVPPAVTLLAANALTVIGAIYALRGAAIARSSLQRASPMFLGFLLLIMLPFFYIVIVGLAMLGIADTWLDFRRRAAPATGVSS